MKHFILALLALGSAAAAADLASSIADLRVEDERLLRIAEPIMAANAALCDQTMPDLGVSLQTVDQYPVDAQPAFAAAVAFAAVLPGSAAEQAGIAPNDGLLSVDGKPLPTESHPHDTFRRDAAFAAIAAHDPARPLEMEVVHAGSRRSVSIPVKPECRAQVELLDNNGYEARTAAGSVIQIAYGFAVRATDQQVAAVFAHELAHAILHHRERLEAAGADNGLLGQLGRSQRLNLRAEDEADRLSVYLLANAGLDPRVAPEFWRSKLGRRMSGGFTYEFTGGILHDLAHPSAKARAAAMDSEIAAHIQPGRVNYPADLLAARTQPMK